MPCEICGAENVLVYPTTVDGVTLRACENCGGKRPSYTPPSFSAPVHHTSSFAPKLNRPRYALDEGLDIIPDLGKRIAQQREKMNISRTELAAMLKIKESVLQKIEHESIKPDDALLTAIEKTLHLTVRTKKENETVMETPSSGSKQPHDYTHLTLSDILEQQLAKQKKEAKK